MEISKLNEIANKLVDIRSLIKGSEEAFENAINDLEPLRDMKTAIAEYKEMRENLNKKLLEAMQEEELKQWKTDLHTFTRAKKESVSIIPSAKKMLIEKVQASPEEYAFLQLKETEYISIRNKKSNQQDND